MSLHRMQPLKRAASSPPPELSTSDVQPKPVTITDPPGEENEVLQAFRGGPP